MFQLKDKLSIDNILSQVSELNLWDYYIDNFKRPYKKFSSELRTDKDPSACIFKANNNRFIYKDFKTGDVYNIFSYLCTKYSCDFKTALSMINNDFNLRLQGSNRIGSNKPAPVIREINEEHQDLQIKVKIREWEEHDIIFWSSYYIPKDILIQYHVFPLSYYWLNNSYFKASKYTYAYYFGDGKFKIYQPLNENYKWISNLKNEYYSGFNQLTKGKDLIITSSHKDCMCYRVLGINAISPQSETISKLDNNILQFILDEYENIYVNYDNDETGIKYSNKIHSLYGFKELFIPNEKDISDYMRKYGIEDSRILIDSLL